MLTLAQELGMTEEELNSVHSYGDLVEIIDELKDLDYGKEEAIHSGRNGTHAQTNDVTDGTGTSGGTVDSTVGTNNGPTRAEGDRAEDRVGENDDSKLGQGEVDHNGIPFVKARNGSTSFGEITAETGLKEAPIKLSVGFHDKNGKGYGLAHIRDQHEDQILKAGFNSVEDFVLYVASNYDKNNVKIGKSRGVSSQTYLIEIEDNHNNTLFIELSQDGGYWNVNSGGIFRKGYSRNKETVTAKTEPKQANTTQSAESSLSENKKGGLFSEPNSESQQFSDSKDSEVVGDVQVVEGEKETAISEGTGAVAGTSSSDSLNPSGKEHLIRQALTHKDSDTKVSNNLENAKRKVKKIKNEGYFLKDVFSHNAIVRNLGNGLDLRRSSSSNSYYGDFVIGGKRVKLRISTHPANAGRMGVVGFDERVSVVVYKNGEHKGDNDADYVEYTYHLGDSSVQDVVRSIVDGVDSLLDGKGFVADESLAEKKSYEGTEAEVVGRVKELSDEFGVDVEIVRDIDEISDASVRRAIEGGRAVKGWFDPATGRVVVYLPNAVDGVDAMLSYVHEVVAHLGVRGLLGANFVRVMEAVYAGMDSTLRLKYMMKYGGDIVEAAEEYIADICEDVYGNPRSKMRSVWDRIVGAVRGALRRLFNLKMSEADVRYMLWKSSQRLRGRAKDIVYHAQDAVLKDSALRSREVESVERVNERFNEQLEKLSESNADSVIFNLGSPSDILLSAGVENKPMKLYGNKVIKKIKKHGFALSELRDLPRAVSDPIAVFNNIGREGNRSILTELKTEQGNFLVTVDLGKDADLDFNIISSVFGKGKDNVIDWFNMGLSTYINKEKAHTFLSHHSAPIAETAANEELSSATKIINEFENSNERGEKVRFREVGVSKGVSNNPDEVFAKVEYERKVSNVGNMLFKFEEAYVDKMLSVQYLQESISKESGKTIKDFEDVYTAENQMNSVATMAKEKYTTRFVSPMTKAVKALINEGNTYEEIKEYVMAKHGLERNMHFAWKNALNYVA